MQSGHEATVVLSLPSHRFAVLFLGVEAIEKLKIGNGQQPWRKSVWGKGFLRTGFLEQPTPAWPGDTLAL